MPEIHFVIRWPDGSVESCYSPSLVVKDYFSPGQRYPLAEFLKRSRVALDIAAERVRAKYGFRCSRAMAQIARIEAGAAAYADIADASVRVDAFEEY